MQYEKLLKKIEKSYEDFLKAKLCREVFDLNFPIPKISIKWNLKLINQEQTKFIVLSEKYEWFLLQTVKTTKGSLIEWVAFQNEASYLKYLSKSRDFLSFQKNLDVIHSSSLQAFLFGEWNFEAFLAKNIFQVNEYDGQWGEILMVVEYFLLHPNSWLYLREIPLPIHTKFIENRKKIIANILDYLALSSGNQYIGNTFEEKFGIKQKPECIRFRFLDETLKGEYFCCFPDDLSFTIEDFETVQFPHLQTVCIVENEINYLTFPPKVHALLLWGKGFEISRVKNISWLQDKEIIYFWDLDSHGFKILSQCRRYLPQTKSICMDWHTYHTFKKYEGEGKTLSSDECEKLSVFLTSEENEILKYVNENNLRLEQENITQEYLIKRLEHLDRSVL